MTTTSFQFFFVLLSLDDSSGILPCSLVRLLSRSNRCFGIFAVILTYTQFIDEEGQFRRPPPIKRGKKCLPTPTYLIHERRHILQPASPRSFLAWQKHRMRLVSKNWFRALKEYLNKLAENMRIIQRVFNVSQRTRLSRYPMVWPTSRIPISKLDTQEDRERENLVDGRWERRRKEPNHTTATKPGPV